VLYTGGTIGMVRNLDGVLVPRSPGEQDQDLEHLARRGESQQNSGEKLKNSIFLS
jgi:hypothetical protein